MVMKFGVKDMDTRKYISMTLHSEETEISSLCHMEPLEVCLITDMLSHSVNLRMPRISLQNTITSQLDGQRHSFMDLQLEWSLVQGWFFIRPVDGFAMQKLMQTVGERAWSGRLWR